MPGSTTQPHIPVMLIADLDLQSYHGAAHLHGVGHDLKLNAENYRTLRAMLPCGDRRYLAQTDRLLRSMQLRLTVCIQDQTVAELGEGVQSGAIGRIIGRILHVGKTRIHLLRLLRFAVSR